MKKILKSVASSLLISILILGTASAGGGGMYYPTYDSPLKDINSLVISPDIKKIISENLVSIINNNIEEDWEFNNKTFYTKKFKANVVIPEDLKMYIKSSYIWVSKNFAPVPYEGMGGGGDTKEVVVTASDIQENVNHLKINLDINNIPGDVILDRTLIDSYIINQYGDSFMGALYLELTDGTTIPFSNNFSFYISKNNNEWKKAHLTNLYYVNNTFAGYANIQSLLEKVFEKLSQNKTTTQYIAILEKVIEKIDAKIKKIEESQNKVVESITKEEDFAKFVKPYGKVIENLNIYNDIKYQVASEVKTKQSKGIIEELFWKDF